MVLCFRRHGIKGGLILIFLVLIVVFGIVSWITTGRYEDKNKIEENRQENANLQSLMKFDDSGETVVFEIIGNDRIRYLTTGKPRIAILTVVQSSEDIQNNDLAITSVKCYARTQSYHYILAIPNDFDCQKTNKFQTDLCVIRKILPSYDIVMLVDVDMGVVYPKRRIEEFIFEGFDVTFLRKFENLDVMLNTFIVKNNEYTKFFLEDLEMYISLYNSEKSAFYFYLAERFFPEEQHSIDLCRLMRNDSAAYLPCIHTILGSHTNFAKIKILKNRNGWSREHWLSNSVWNKEIGDFMFHGWKNPQVRRKPNGGGRIPIYRGSKYEWYNPLKDFWKIQVDRCHPKNMSWSYDQRLIGDREELEDHFNRLEKEVAKAKLLSYSGMVAAIFNSSQSV